MKRMLYLFAALSLTFSLLVGCNDTVDDPETERQKEQEDNVNEADDMIKDDEMDENYPDRVDEDSMNDDGLNGNDALDMNEDGELNMRDLDEDENNGRDKRENDTNE